MNKPIKINTKRGSKHTFKDPRPTVNSTHNKIIAAYKAFNLNAEVSADYLNFVEGVKIAMDYCDGTVDDNFLSKKLLDLFGSDIKLLWERLESMGFSLNEDVYSSWEDSGRNGTSGKEKR